MQYANTAPDPNPIEISVVVPVRDEEESVRALLEWLLNQTLPPKEILITDGGSVDTTTEIIEEFIERGAPVKLFREHNSLPGRARNVGAKQAGYEWIAFTDAGTRSGPEWLAALAEKAGDGSAADVIYGSYEPVVDSFFKECAAIAYVPPPASTPEGFVRPRSIVSTLMRRKVWEEVGGFPEGLRSAEDLIFMRRVEQAKFKITRAPEAIVYWDIQSNLRLTFNRFVEYSLNNIRAGLFAEWQGSIFIYYALLAASTFNVLFLGPPGLFLPPALWLLFMAARATKALLQNRKNYSASFGRNVIRLVMLVPIIATLDVAAFIGSINWLFCDKFRRKSSRGEDDARE